jgi:hypothetical protein
VAADGPIAYGSHKTSNTLFTNGMDPCTSVSLPHLPTKGGAGALQTVVHLFGVALLELLAQGNCVIGVKFGI